jgi:hypothetical protein
VLEQRRSYCQLSKFVHAVILGAGNPISLDHLIRDSAFVMTACTRAAVNLTPTPRLKAKELTISGLSSNEMRTVPSSSWLGPLTSNPSLPVTTVINEVFNILHSNSARTTDVHRGQMSRIEKFVEL